MKRTLWIILFLIFGLTVFQNCSRVNLVEKPEQLADYFLAAKGGICLDDDFENYDLEQFSIYNLNMLSFKSTILADSDSDGLSDQDEIRYGFDPLKARSNGKLLDKVCFDLRGSADCLDLTLNCTGAVVGLGLSDCEIEALDLDSISQVSPGIDADKDGILDFIEIIKGLAPNEFNPLEDPDHDFIPNRTEIDLGTNPNYYDRDIKTIFKTSFNIRKADHSEAQTCQGNFWKIDINRVPYLKLDAYIESMSQAKVTLDHTDQENNALMVVILKPITGLGNKVYLYKNIKVDRLQQVRAFSLSDFSVAGEVAQ